MLCKHSKFLLFAGKQKIQYFRGFGETASPFLSNLKRFVNRYNSNQLVELR
jgi:hypothetical protein